MKKWIALASVLILAISISIVVFIVIKDKQNNDSVAEQVTPEGSTESLYDSANATVSDNPETVVQEDYTAYIGTATDAINSMYSDTFTDMEIKYVETIDTGIKNHVFEVEHTDLIVNVCVDDSGNFSLMGPCNRYGSDYSIVWFDIEPVSRLDVYDFLFEVAGVDCYRFDENQMLTNLNTGETYDYGKYAGTTDSGVESEPEQSNAGLEPEQSDIGAGDDESGSTEFSAG